MRAALYVRRSTDEHQASSLEVQLEEGRRFIANKGWGLVDEHVFVEDAVSRAEFKKRPALIAMLNAAEARTFDVVVTRDDSRLGGDMARTSLLIQDLLDSGVRLFFYFSDEEITVDGAVDKFMVAARNFAAELEREKTAQRTHEHLLTKARRGLNAGGRCFGYDNVEVFEGERRVRVEYRINEDQARIVRDIFQLYASGVGLKGIVKSLNARGISSPRAGKRGTGSWSPSAIGAMLRRETYRGIVVWNQREKKYRGGTKVRELRPECEWVRVEVPELRIIDEDVWLAVHARIKDSAGTARSRGRPHKYLLSGLARCSECGGPIQVINGKQGSRTVKVYVCSYYRERGTEICTSSTRRPVDEVNDAVIGWVLQNILSEELLSEAMRHIRARLAERSKQTRSNTHALEKEAKQLRAELDRLVNAVATTDDKPDALIKAISDRQRRLSSLEADIRAAKAAPAAIANELTILEQEARRRLQDLHQVFQRNPAEARRVLEALFTSRLTVSPASTEDGKRFQVTGETSIARMLVLAGNWSSKFASPAGFEPALLA